jgi:hypothetical protein
MIEEIHKSYFDYNFKIPLGILWCCTYVNCRPSDILSIQEKHIDLARGEIDIPVSKTEPKVIFLIYEDREILKNIPRGKPEDFFFRHNEKAGKRYEGGRFNKQHLYKKWIEVGKKLKINSDMYGGSRHTSTTFLGNFFSSSQIQDATMHGGKLRSSFGRYFSFPPNKLRYMYTVARWGWCPPKMPRNGEEKYHIDLMKYYKKYLPLQGWKLLKEALEEL